MHNKCPACHCGCLHPLHTCDGPIITTRAGHSSTRRAQRPVVEVGTHHANLDLWRSGKVFPESVTIIFKHHSHNVGPSCDVIMGHLVWFWSLWILFICWSALSFSSLCDVWHDRSRSHRIWGWVLGMCLWADLQTPESLDYVCSKCFLILFLPLTSALR